MKKEYPIEIIEFEISKDNILTLTQRIFTHRFSELSWYDLTTRTEDKIVALRYIDREKVLRLARLV